jgi:Ulp1 family protease
MARRVKQTEREAAAALAKREAALALHQEEEEEREQQRLEKEAAEAAEVDEDDDDGGVGGDGLPIRGFELDEDEDEQANDILDQSAQGGDVLAEAFNVELTRRDLLCLWGLEWLNDEVLNFYFKMIMAKVLEKKEDEVRREGERGGGGGGRTCETLLVVCMAKMGDTVQ